MTVSKGDRMKNLLLLQGVIAFEKPFCRIPSDGFFLSDAILGVRYRVKVKVRPGKAKPLLESIDAGSLGKGSIARDEYIYNMNEARVSSDGVAT